MQAFEYANPTTLKEAVGLLAAQWGETEILAGGTDLLSLMKNYVAVPKRLVNIKGIAELKGVRAGAQGWTIGALVTFEELLASASVRTSFPSLTHAAEGVSSPQIRNMGTVGGDLCQRPRCWYYRNGFGLLARDERGESLVTQGENRYHSIFGSGPAYFVNPSSLAPALIALGAKARIVGPKGQREVALGEFFVAPRSEAERENVLQPNEIVSAVLIPSIARGWANSTYEVRQKLALDWPLGTASVAVKLTAGKVTGAHIVLGHVAAVPWPAKQAAEWLVGKAVTAENAAKAGEAAVSGAKPLSGNRYKVQLARTAVKRALLAATKGGA